MGLDWKGVLGNIAPTIAGALSGPLAGRAVAALSQKLLGKPAASDDELASAIAGATPEQIAELKKLDQEFALKLVDAAVQLEQIEASDRANARQREVQTHDWTTRALALAIFAAFFGLLILMLVHAIPAENERPFDILLGMLGAGVTSVLSYYFGTSASSRAKDAVLGRLANK